jgi:hypothetical protein
MSHSLIHLALTQRKRNRQPTTTKDFSWQISTQKKIVEKERKKKIILEFLIRLIKNS